VSLKGVPVGEWRDLTEKELAVLLKSVEDSSSENSIPAKKSPVRRPRKTSRPDAKSIGNTKGQY